MSPEQRSIPDIERQLTGFLAGRTCLLGIGSRWWHDDGAGSIMAHALQGRSELDAIDTGFVPENFLEFVVHKQPDTILLADATDFGGEPGEARLMDPQRIVANAMPTHAGSLHLLATYLHERTGAPVMVLAIQPLDISSGEGLSPAVARTVHHLEDLLPKLCGCLH